ncbi:hypothetical protein [Streptomyces sp. RG80]|uniref:hypothetical protein n=1 Tax=Streptomyces sp. RG80 TaxID=3157340 RepID=UPI00338E1429
MDDAQKVDQDAVQRARTMLLGSDGLSVAEQVEAYRVLSVVSPLTYVPKLADALVAYGYEPELRDLPDVRLVWHAEAVATARRIDEGDPNRTELLVRVLDSYQRGLYAAGRREEGFAILEEMAEAGRWGYENGQVKIPGYGQRQLAVVLAEEGRYEEAAEVCAKGVADERNQPRWRGYPSAAVEWVSVLEAAGRQEEALEAFAELVDYSRDEVAAGDTFPSILVWRLVYRSGMLDAAGCPTQAGTDRQEALVLLAELDRAGEDRRWSGVSSWVTLLALSGRSAEPVPTPEAPAPPFGWDPAHWSREVRKAYLDGLGPLEEQLTALREDPSASLPELLALHRRLAIRTAVFQEQRHGSPDLKPLHPLFDEGVALARRLGERQALGRALTDRSMFLLAAKQYGEAYGDFREACELLDR